MNSVSERIKQVRSSVMGKKLTQDEFAEMLGVTRSVVTNWEDAERRLPNGIPERSLRHICKVFHVNFLWLTEGEGPMMETMTTDALVDKYMAGESPIAISIMKAFAKLPDEEWVKLRDLIDRIKKEGHP